jgi:taurine dioxygenase
MTTREAGVLEWKRLDAGFGVEVERDAGVALTASEQQAFRVLLAEHSLCVFRGACLTLDEQARLLSILGPLMSVDFGAKGLISTDPELGKLGTIPLPFHSDLAFTPEPIQYISLHALEVGGTTSTRFASGARAYVTLAASLRARIQDLNGLHVMPIDMTRRNRSTDVPANFPRCAHPLAFVNSRSHEPVLYLNEEQIDSIIGLTEDESEALIAELMSELYDPANIYEHTWQVGDLVVWDNITLQHGRGDQSAVGARTLQRVAVGTSTIEEMFPGFSLDAYNDQRVS